MRSGIISNLFNRSKKAGHLLILGSLFSCGSGAIKRPNLQQAQTKGLLKMEIMALWAKAEYRRLLGDELGAQNLERDLKELELQMSGLDSDTNEAIGSN